MSQAIYRRKAILTRIHRALDAFYLLQRIDWEYDIRSTLEKILGLALEELELEGGRQIERGLIIIQPQDGGNLEIHAGWKASDPDLAFSRTVVQQTIESGEPILCENAKDDPRFMEAESIKHLETLSLISVPLQVERQRIGALYIESKSPRNLFNEADLDFLREFTDTITPYLKTALTHHGHLEAIRKLREELVEHYSFSSILGRSRPMRSVFELIKIAADVDRTVLLTGESGCGKELIAHAIHYNGPRRGHAFVVVDCSSLAEHILESELFGHKKGAFTGAANDKIGAFEEADGGTIFLDEISDASKPLQQKLRRVLQEGEIRRVGENLPRKVNVRVICATNKDLGDLVERGEILRDFYFRINKFPIRVPPLRERREDIPILVEHFLKNAAPAAPGGPLRIHADALELLVNRAWAENNVRELRNTVELAVDLSPGGEVTRPVVERVFRVQRGEPEEAPAAAAPRRVDHQPAAGDLVWLSPPAFRDLLARVRDSNGSLELPKEETPFYRIQLEVAAKAIIEGLRATGWKLRPAARLLGISPTKLRAEFKEYVSRTLMGCGGKLDEAARALEIPTEILVKKAADLGLDEVIAGVKP
ncbi:MAG TPA: sigma 54-interacting transcriptional regulator [Planctomycetota bacterium]|nr:sigma 54-interacting transcriptional regulator [Planctomycetota bacterium]